MDRYCLEPTDFSISFVREIAERFRSGEVGILPTETVYGLMCSKAEPEAVERIFRIKQRDFRKKFQVLISSVDNIGILDVPLTTILQHLAKRFWPGPLTVIVQDAKGEDVGVRIPDDRFLLSILTRMKCPLVATSANVAGGDPARSLSNNFNDLVPPPDFVVIGEHASGPPSTVIRLRKDCVTLVREGRISLQVLQEFLDEIPDMTLSDS